MSLFIVCAEIVGTVSPIAATDEMHQHSDVGKHVSKYMICVQFNSIFCAENEVIVDETENQGSNYVLFLIVYINFTDFQDVILPPKLKKRGRPKGAEKTIIGLPRKKKKSNKSVPFLKKLPVDRERGIIFIHVQCKILLTQYSYPSMVC